MLHLESRCYRALSLNRYRRGDIDGALKLFEEESAIVAHLEYILGAGF
ncbi:MAG: hypothetical protein R3D26_07885 [Cyanobacteriota/Melainabacteria group bacterium]